MFISVLSKYSTENQHVCVCDLHKEKEGRKDQQWTRNVRYAGLENIK